MNDGTQNNFNLELEWIPVASIGSCGHGIEFHYKTNGDSIRIGFIDGFGWMHKTDNKVKVYLLASNSEEWDKLLPKAENILKDLKDFIYSILQENNSHGRIKNNIVAWVNG